VSFRIRPARNDDFKALYEMAKLTGGGFTNLPADKGALVEKLIRSEHAFARKEDGQGDDLFVFMLEDAQSGRVRGTCQVFSQVGSECRFYSYRITTLSQTSKELGRTFRGDMLNLVTDFDGCSEVGGLFLHPQARAGGLGMLLARSRYLFIKLHRERFAGKVMAELRGVIDEGGNSPFWDAIAGRFFGMSFRQADEFNAMHGTQFIADLMPKTPIYVAMLPDNARAVMGLPHPSGRAAMKMLEGEGFSFDGYIDIFDGGPTMAAPTDRIRTIAGAHEEVLAGTSDEEGGQPMLVAAGRLADFAACWGRVGTDADGRTTLDAKSAALLGLQPGDRFVAAPR
jgi:arginine N-succinyltransferase